MRHDPERNAAAYLGGVLSGTRRRIFERHMVDCEDCWREVQLGRTGRSVAESGRELAPQSLRERVRAAVETVSPPPRKRWLLGTSAIGVIALIAMLVVFASSEVSQPAQIQAALASFRHGDLSGQPASALLPKQLDHMELVEVARTSLKGTEVVAHVYVDRTNTKVVVYVADEEWPVAHRAIHDRSAKTWTARSDELVLVCLNEPAPSLVVGDDAAQVAVVAASLQP